MTYKEIYDIVMPEAKRKEERFNFWVTIAVRPLSVLCTIPLTKTKIKPTTVTKWSIVSLIIGFFLIVFSNSMTTSLVGWLFFFIWAVLDGVDGNLARSTNQCSPLGDLWDTMGGYLSMVLIYFSAGIAAFHDTNLIVFCESYLLLILGGATALCSIFPRLILHKKKSSDLNSAAVKDISDKKQFGIGKIAAMNLISPSGFMEVIFLGAIVFHILNIFIAFYFIVNFFIMMGSLRVLLRESHD